MPDTLTWQHLDEALYALWARANAAVKTLAGVEGTARTIVQYATDTLPLLAQAETFQARPRYEADFDARNGLVGIYNKLRDALGELQRLQGHCLRIVQDQDHLLTPLRNEAVALLGIAQAIAPDAGMVGARQAELEQRIRDYNKSVTGSFLGSLDPGLARQWNELQATHAALEARRMLAQRAAAALPDLATRAATLSALDRRAQLQRGTWVLVGDDLASAAAQLGDRTGTAIQKWSLSRTASRLQSAAIRSVRDRAANYVVTSEPPGAATHAAAG